MRQRRALALRLQRLRTLHPRHRLWGHQRRPSGVTDLIADLLRSHESGRRCDHDRRLAVVALYFDDDF